MEKCNYISREEISPDKLKLSEKQLKSINIRGYSAFAQDMFGFSLGDLYYYNSHNKKLSIRTNLQLDPFQTLKIDPSKAQDLINGVEASLKRLNDFQRPREVMAIRLYYGLDQSKNEFTTYEDIGKIFCFSTERARQLAVRGMRRMRILDRNKELKSLLSIHPAKIA
jgi:hypothetical protein